MATGCSRSSSWSGTGTAASRWRPGRRGTPELKALVDDAMAAGVSFATRGNLILLAPPLVIEERELADALALLDRLLGRHFPPG